MKEIHLAGVLKSVSVAPAPKVPLCGLTTGGDPDHL